MDCSRFREDMLDVLYGEADPAVAARFEAHRDSCSDCQDEIAGFQRVRSDLQVWRADMPGTRRRRLLPGFRGLAAAAAVVLAFGGGLSLARTDVSYRDGELRVVFGGGGGAARARSGDDVAQLLARHEAEHRAELEAIRASMMQPVTSTGNANNDAVLQRMQQMLQQSEQRQRTMMQTGLKTLASEVAVVRQQDLYAIGASLAALDYQTANDVARLGNAAGAMPVSDKK
jgi:hypothetical protein